MVPRFFRRNVEFVTVCNDIHVSDRSKSHTGTPALPLSLRTKCLKPNVSAYPKTFLTIGDRIRTRRLDLGLLQKQLAASFGVTEDTVCYWENMRVKPSLRNMNRIYQFLCGLRGTVHLDTRD